MIIPLLSFAQGDTLNAENEFWSNGNIKSQKIHTGYHTYYYTSWHINGKRHIEGSYSYSDYLRIENSWDSTGNQMVVNGIGRQVYYDGLIKVEEGLIEEGLPSGVWIEYFKTGEKKAEINYARGQKEGECVFWSKDGNKTQEKRCTKNFCHYWNYWDEDGNQMIKEGDGYLILYYTNGNKNAEGPIKNGKKFGDWSEWFENGQIRLTCKYKESNDYFNPPIIAINCWDSLGNQIGKDGTGCFMFYNEENQLIEKSYLTNSSWDGLNITYYSYGLPEIEDLHENGKWIHRTIYHNNGFKAYDLNTEFGYETHGRVRNWHYNGQLKSDEYYDKGTLLKQTTYYANGQKEMERNFCKKSEIEGEDGFSMGVISCEEEHWDRSGKKIMKSK